MLIEEVLGTLKHWLDGKKDIQLAMLYGSFATGQAHEKSDLDIAISLDRPLSTDERIQYAQELGALIKRPVDLVDLFSARGLILKEILSSNQFLVKRDSDLFAKIITRLWFEESDFGPIRKKIIEERRTRVFGN